MCVLAGDINITEPVVNAYVDIYHTQVADYIRLYSIPNSSLYESSFLYMCPYSSLYVSSYYYKVYLPHSGGQLHTPIYVSSNNYLVRIPHSPLYVSSFHCVSIFLPMCPHFSHSGGRLHTTIYASSYYYVSVLILLCVLILL